MEKRHGLRPGSKSFFATFIALVGFVSLFGGAVGVAVNSTQADVLINEVLRDLEPYNNSTFFSSWNKTNNCSEWLGVTCDTAGHVIELILSTEDIFLYDGDTIFNATMDLGGATTNSFGDLLVGEISPNISKLSTLEVLVLRRHGLLGIIPPSIGNLKKLVSLDLGGNYITGAIPDTITNLTQLTYLNLHGNSLQSVIPSSFGKLKNLTTLDLGENGMSGSILSAIKGLTKLTYLDLGQNNIKDGDVSTQALSDEIDAQFTDLVNLKYLDLHECNFTGTPGSFLNTLVNLEYLDLEGNSFEGLLVDFPERHDSLKEMYLGGNDFDESEFPANFGNYSKLLVLDLSLCSVEGALPNELNNIISLRTLDLSGNYLTSLPSDLSSLTNLTELNLANNQLTSIDSLSTLKNLRSLQIQNNGLTGKFPEFSSFLDIEYLDASTNFLTADSSGGIPLYFTTFTNLTTLKLDMNSFGGQIPAAFSNLVSLTVLSLSKCNLEGGIPSNISNLINLQTLDLHDNLLTGEIPSGIGGISTLTTLDLSYNQLNGTIPESIKSSSIETLILNNNELIGDISNSFAPNINKLWLFSNNFAGGIPSEIGTLNNLADLQLQDNTLTNGIPPELFNIPVDSIHIDLSRNALGGVIPPEISNFNSSLTALWLVSCGLQGSLPSGLSSLNKLQYLDLSGNNFTGAIPALNNLALLERLSLSKNPLQFSVSILPDSYNLEILDLSALGSGFSELPNLPSSYESSLLTLNLEDNNIAGNIPSKYFDPFTTLQAVFLKGNAISGDVGSVSEIPRANKIEFISLARNNITLATESFSATGITLDLSNNPICRTSKVPSIVAFCQGSGNSFESYIGAPVCDTNCSDINYLPNAYIKSKEDKCVCSAYIGLELSFFETPLSYISNKCLSDVREWVAGMIGIYQEQVYVVSANLTGKASIIFELNIFGVDKNAPSGEVLVAIYGLNRLTARALGQVNYVRVLPELVPIKKSKGIAAWIIAVIVTLVLLFIIVSILLAWYCRNKRAKKTVESNPMLPQSTFVEGSRQYVQFKSDD